MTRTEIYRSESDKPLQDYLADLTRIAQDKGFLINNEENMDMARSFTQHGYPVPDDFDLHMVQLCKPEKASKSLSMNPDRAPLMPKFIMLFSRDGKTRVRLLTYGEDLIAELIDDKEFPGSLAQSFEAIKTIIEEAR